MNTNTITTTFDAADLKILGQKHIGNGLARMSDFVMERGEGSYIYTDKKKFLDFSSGIGVTNLGHCHPVVTEAVINQVKTITHAQCTLGFCRPYVELVEKLLQIMPDESLDTMLFLNSGSEAIDNAIKVARKATGRQNVICMQGAFHGRTYGSSALSRSKTVYAHEVGPVISGVFATTLPYWHQLGVPAETSENAVVERAIFDLDALFLQQCAPQDTAAIFIEPVIGEGGYIPVPNSYMKALRERCDKYGILLVIDEIQSGFGRTGAMFAIEHSGVRPDIMTFAKGVANGFPLSGIVANGSIMHKMGPGMQGGTYSGNAVACAAGLAVHKVFKEEDIIGNVKSRSAELFNMLNELKQSEEGRKLIADVRGHGLMLYLLKRMSHSEVVLRKAYSFLPRLSMMSFALSLLLTSLRQKWKKVAKSSSSHSLKQLQSICKIINGFVFPMDQHTSIGTRESSRYQFKLIDSPKCRKCGADGSISHRIFICRRHIIARIALRGKITRISIRFELGLIFWNAQAL
ncbi:acetylornithine aminotransferase [Wallemia mellicola]|uniref:Acetylornithine aminotransferase n=1 Tax=Wallemia mellicola TaxID=1708541 RepID=A0A4T0LZ94_9BASI|nr:acetylornithine aminotransferase [Wallemia mellicola]TIC07974.1 acetylornithine aminotransferase [Wallemia mellicola]